MKSRRIWSEHVPYWRLCEPRLLDTLREHQLRLLFAVRPHTVADATEVLRACEASGVEVGLWPLLEDTDGRWVNTGNLPLFETQLQRLMDVVHEHGVRPREIVFDLEPSFTHTRALLHRRRRALRMPLQRAAAPRASQRLARLVDTIRARGMEATAAIAPMLVWDAQTRHTGWQRLLGTPIEHACFDRYDVAIYNSLLEGYTRGLLQRRDTRGLLAELCCVARDHYGDRASVSLGVVQVGALGNERPYRSARELAEDASIAQAAGLTQLSLHELAGVLMRPPAERWLRTFASTPPAASRPPPTWRGRVLGQAGRGLSRSLETLTTWRDRIEARIPKP